MQQSIYYIKFALQINGGYYVSTNFSTSDKAEILRKISDELELGLKVSLVDKD